MGAGHKPFAAMLLGPTFYLGNQRGNAGKQEGIIRVYSALKELGGGPAVDAERCAT